MWESPTTVGRKSVAFGYDGTRCFYVQGKLIRALVNGKVQAGSYSVFWDGKDEQDREVSSGAYIYYLQLDNKVLSRSMIHLK
ncbi:MAG: FlgD immunoglobulin-like domain containing protein [bacterium]